MEKVLKVKVVPRNVALAIKSFRDADFSDFGIVNAVYQGMCEYGFAQEIKALNNFVGVDLDLLQYILVVGYEVEKTPHEQILELFENEWNDNERSVVHQALDILNIKVSGVNN